MESRIQLTLLALLGAALIAGCDKPQPPAAKAPPPQAQAPVDAADVIYVGGDIVTINDKSKGSLETGKLADLVILDRNPLKVDRMAIKDITVVETVKEGKTIYRKQ